MSLLAQIDRAYQTKQGLLLWVLVEVVAAYIFGSWAIDSGNGIDYLLTLVFLLSGIQNLVKLIMRVVTRRQHG